MGLNPSGARSGLIRKSELPDYIQSNSEESQGERVSAVIHRFAFAILGRRVLSV
jgi:hypothetical protein